MKKWFDTWFDTKYYHILYQNRDYSEAELFITNLVKNLNIETDSNILDLACGKGRHSVFLNKLGYKTTGVDLSKESIGFAKKSETNTLDFFVHDMREPIKNKKFDFVFNLFTSIGYFEDPQENVRMLKSIESYLTADGVLVIDFMNAQKVIDNLVLVEQKKINGIEFNISREVKDGFIIKKIEFNDKGESYSFHEKVQVLKLDDFENYLKKANFKIINIAGDYNLGNFDIKASNRLIIFAKKN